ncbi:hypothetical protein C0J52_03601 [Blattella germanica]|nr:hypothetical protein C0J52_03601 [Blattella germanica]
MGNGRALLKAVSCQNCLHEEQENKFQHFLHQIFLFFPASLRITEPANSKIKTSVQYADRKKNNFFSFHPGKGAARCELSYLVYSFGLPSVYSFGLPSVCLQYILLVCLQYILLDILLFGLIINNYVVMYYKICQVEEL